MTDQIFKDYITQAKNSYKYPAKVNNCEMAF